MKMLPRLSLIHASTLFLLLPAFSLGENRGTRIAVCNLSRLLTECEMSRDRAAELEAMRIEAKNKVEKLTKQMEKLGKELPLLNQSSEEYKKKQEELRKLINRREATDRSEKAFLSSQQARFLKDFYREAAEAVRRVAEEKGFDIVLQLTDIQGDLGKPRTLQELSNRLYLQTILYNDTRVDITDLVKKRLNDTYKKKKEQKP